MKIEDVSEFIGKALKSALDESSDQIHSAMATCAEDQAIQGKPMKFKLGWSITIIEGRIVECKLSYGVKRSMIVKLIPDDENQGKLMLEM